MDARMKLDHTGHEVRLYCDACHKQIADLGLAVAAWDQTDPEFQTQGARLVFLHKGDCDQFNRQKNFPRLESWWNPDDVLRLLCKNLKVSRRPK